VLWKNDNFFASLGKETGATSGIHFPELSLREPVDWCFHHFLGNISCFRRILLGSKHEATAEQATVEQKYYFHVDLKL